MDQQLKQRFLSATLRFRKMDVCCTSSTDMHYNELMVLCEVTEDCSGHAANLNVSEIQNRLHISRPAVSQILNSLEKKGCIVRQIDPGDRRRISIAVTEYGREAMDRAIACHDRMLEQVFRAYGIANVMQLTEQLDSLADIFEQLKQERWK